MIHASATDAWLTVLQRILFDGGEEYPRGKSTLEVLSSSVSFDMRYPVVEVAPRKLSWKFMAAEALWILSGDDRVSTIQPWNRNIAAFSDDGERFFGAYGPKFVDQVPYVIRKLEQDPSSRQAVITLWRESPPDSRDVPCTICLVFQLRKLELHTHVFMRSSDAWLGVPYDFFNFSMMSVEVLTHLNWRSGVGYGLGALHWTAASSHLYEPNLTQADRCLEYGNHDSVEHAPYPATWLAKKERLHWTALEVARTNNAPPLWLTRPPNKE